LFFFQQSPHGLDWVLKFQAGLTPPLAMGLSFPITFFEEDNERMFGRDDWVQMMIFGLIGVLIWAFAAAILWGIVSARFRAMTNRTRFARLPMERLPHRPRRRSDVVSHNGLADTPSPEAASPKIVDVQPALDEDAILDVLRGDEPPRENSG